MLQHRYKDFVKASSRADNDECKQAALSGDQAKEIYLKEIQDASNTTSAKKNIPKRRTANPKQRIQNISNKDLFLCVQNNDVEVLKDILDCCPSLINTVDEYGWSLLMIACQANSVDAVKELLARGADTSVRDKGGNSATNLIIKNKNLEIADLLITHGRSNCTVSLEPSKEQFSKATEVVKESYRCEICNNKVFPDKNEHLASTIHNINSSKDKKLPTHYAIPQNNRGYQIMLKVGWDREHGLGRDGSGKKYPIKAVQKKDRMGLGLDKKKIKEESKGKVENQKNNKIKILESRSHKRMEINFRREFY